MLKVYLSPLIALVCLSTTTGLFLHETKVDKLAILTMAAPVVAAQKVASGGLLDSMPHTHSEAGILETSAREFRGKTPGMTPRRDKHKYRMNKNVPRGFHLFDSYHLPLEAITQ